MSDRQRQQVEQLRAEFDTLPGGLRAHVERVATEAADLARHWDVDPLRVELAVWGHDLFRAIPEAELVAVAERAGVRVRKADRRSPIVLHGPIAAAVMEERFGIDDVEVLLAVAQHTLGGRDMPLIAKVILVADKVEERKRERDPVLRDIRRLARRDLDLALLCWADWKWVEERANGWESHPAHWKARRRWVRVHHAEVELGFR